MLAKTQKKSESSGCFINVAIGALIIVLIWEWLWPDVMPFELGTFLSLKVGLVELLQNCWPILAYAGIVTGVIAILTQNKPEENRAAEAGLAVGSLISAFAGFAEEIAFRWLIFFSAMIGVQITNTIFFGFLGFGIPEWFYLNIAGPVANFATFGLLQPWLFSSYGWFVGAAIISSNGQFRNGHLYLGPIGYINSWFIGMIMFHIMFTYGLVGAIIMHFLYDLVIFVVRYLDQVIERAMGNK